MINKNTPESTFTKWENAFKELLKGTFFEDAAKELEDKLNIKIDFTEESGFMMNK